MKESLVPKSGKKMEWMNQKMEWLLVCYQNFLPEFSNQGQNPIIRIDRLSTARQYTI